MHISQATALILQTIPFIILEYRGQKIEEVKYTDKKTGQTACFCMLNLAGESLGEGEMRQFTVRVDPPRGSQVVPDAVDPTKRTIVDKDGKAFQLDYKKGDKVLCIIRDMETVKGHTTYFAQQTVKVDMVEETQPSPEKKK